MERKLRPTRPDDARNPQSVYGRSKAEAEVRLLEVLPDCCIARTSWLFGTGGKCFPDTILKLAASRPALDVVNDQRGCPTYSVDLARAIIATLPQRMPAELCTPRTAGDCTWFEFAREIVNRARPCRPRCGQSAVSRWRDLRPARPIPFFRRRACTVWNRTLPIWQDALRALSGGTQRLSVPPNRCLPVAWSKVRRLWSAAEFTPIVKSLLNYIDGQFVRGKREFADVNPADGSVIAQVTEADQALVDDAVQAARKALGREWGRLGHSRTRTALHQSGECDRIAFRLLCRSRSSRYRQARGARFKA